MKRSNWNRGGVRMTESLCGCVSRYQHKRSKRTVRTAMYEALENRQMLSLLGVAPVGCPHIYFDTVGALAYKAGTSNFDGIEIDMRKTHRGYPQKRQHLAIY